MDDTRAKPVWIKLTGDAYLNLSRVEMVGFEGKDEDRVAKVWFSGNPNAVPFTDENREIILTALNKLVAGAHPATINTPFKPLGS